MGTMIFKRIREDIEAFKQRDPAARGSLAIVVCYPGFHAILCHRLARWLWKRDWYLVARALSHVGRLLTGIEIHPGAEIGRRFVIDHGSGVVIGETAVIGDDVTLYHQVTLGGTAPSVDSEKQRGRKRHPTIEDDVIVGCGAAVLGPITIGKGARVGANAVVTKDVPAEVTAVGNPAQVILPKDKRMIGAFQAYGTPTDGQDPIMQTIENMRTQIGQMAERIKELEEERSENNERREKGADNSSEDGQDQGVGSVVVSGGKS